MAEETAEVEAPAPPDDGRVAVTIDGTTVRIPFRGWFLPDGTNMENHGATPDVLVTQTPEDESRGYDAQLKAAVDDLMKRIK